MSEAKHGEATIGRGRALLLSSSAAVLLLLGALGVIALGDRELRRRSELWAELPLGVEAPAAERRIGSGPSARYEPNPSRSYHGLRLTWQSGAHDRAREIRVWTGRFAVAHAWLIGVDENGRIAWKAQGAT